MWSRRKGFYNRKFPFWPFFNCATNFFRPLYVGIKTIWMKWKFFMRQKKKKFRFSLSTGARRLGIPFGLLFIFFDSEVYLFHFSLAVVANRGRPLNGDKWKIDAGRAQEWRQFFEFLEIFLGLRTWEKWKFNGSRECWDYESFVFILFDCPSRVLMIKIRLRRLELSRIHQSHLSHHPCSCS